MNGNALSYLLRTKMRNQLKSFFQKPIRIIYIVIFLALIVLTVIGGNDGANEADRKLRDLSELTAGINALFILMFATTFNAGLKNGGSFFKMADVNFLFPSPLNKRNVLFYALVQQMGTSLLIGLFILFQYSALHVNYNLSVLGLILIFLCYSLTVFLSQAFAMFVYTYVSDSDRKRNTAKSIFYALIILLLAYIGMQVLQHRDAIVQTLATAGNSIPIKAFPFAGWLGSVVGGILKGNYIEAFIWLAISVTAFYVMLTALAKSKRDYYEDVLASAETIQSVSAAAKDGVAPEAAPRNIKVGKIGIGKGNGASVFFYKHLLENRRISKILISPMSLMFIVFNIGFSFFMKDNGILPLFIFSSYIMIFSVALGRFNRELTKPYIYLVPEPPLKKLVFALAETLPTEILESILIFVPVLFIMDISVIDFIVCVLSRVVIAILFIAASVAIERIWGGSISKLVGILLYFVIDIILLLPGTILAIVVSSSGLLIINMEITIMLCLTVCNLPVSLLVLYLCRNVLQYAET